MVALQGILAKWRKYSPRAGRGFLGQRRTLYRGRNGASGFVLVMTLLAMAAIFVVIVAMLSLSLAESASQNAAGHLPQARNNAVLALDEAISNLQRMSGADTRVTASAEAVAGVNGSPYVTGVWRSWEGLDHDTATGLPTKPDYDIKTVGYNESSPATGRFLGWLVSDSQQNNAANDPPVVAEDVNAGTVPLLHEGTLGSGASDKEVHMVPTLIRDSDDTYDAGSYAWWVQGENSKALIADLGETPGNTSADISKWGERLASFGRPDAEGFGFADPDQLAVLPSRKAMDLASSTDNVSGVNYHDITAYTRGLLTNTANGGWRRDLSLMSENYASIPASEMKFFTLEPGKETLAMKNSGAAGGLIYPWAIESNHAPKDGGATVGWGALVEYATQYKQIVSSSSLDDVTFDQKAAPDRNGVRDGISRLPVLARIHWVLSYTATPNGTEFDAKLNMDAVVTYWNPYNVVLSGNTPEFWLQVETAIPYKIQFSVGGRVTAEKELADWTGTKNFTLAIPAETEDWQPGETRVYSIASKPGTNRYLMARGYETPVGFDRSVGLTGASGEEFKVVLSSIDGSGAFKFNAYEWRGDRNNNVFKIDYEVDYAQAEEFWGAPEVANTSQTIDSLDGVAPVPFMIQRFELQNILESSVGARGYSTKKPLVNAMSNGSSGLTGIEHFPYDVVLDYPNAGGASSGDGRPVDGISATDSYSFIGTSYTLGDGMKSLIVAEVPTRPLRSLGELQHFDLTAYNPVPPYVAEPLGNSNALYLIDPDEVFRSDGYAQAESVSYDHSYVANHLFFDDWFVSSIAPETNGYSSSEIRDTTKVYTDFISGAEPLPNQVYVPAEVLSPTDAATEAPIFIDDNTSWHSVASKLEVEGMFNINSTSVEAWAALLKHLRGAQVPYSSLSDNMVKLDVDSSHPVAQMGANYPVSRTSIAGDPYSPSNTGYGQVGHHSRLTDEQVEALAREIVNQVKLRGPFLSLSEFVNRKLTDDSSEQELALAGAVEAALVELSTKPATENPFEYFSSFGDVDNNPNWDVNQKAAYASRKASYAFPKAAEGSLAYGFPGWIRQADVLRPLTPVLSARDDTFVIRAYGDSRNQAGKTLARAWCEAVVQRQADYVDADTDQAGDFPSVAINELFGRRFKVVSFRWLSSDEV